MRALHPGGPDRNVQGGILTLDIGPDDGSKWTPTWLRWDSEDGWRATLHRADREYHEEALRYLRTLQPRAARGYRGWSSCWRLAPWDDDALCPGGS